MIEGITCSLVLFQPVTEIQPEWHYHICRAKRLMQAVLKGMCQIINNHIDNRWVIYQSNIMWVQLVKCEDFLPFTVLHHFKWNISGWLFGQAAPGNVFTFLDIFETKRQISDRLIASKRICSNPIYSFGKHLWSIECSITSLPHWKEVRKANAG